MRETSCELLLVRMIVRRAIVLARTGRVIDGSTARFPGVAAAGLAQRDPAPQVADQFVQLFANRHRLVHIGKKVLE